jgi:hypothetical protein
MDTISTEQVVLINNSYIYMYKGPEDDQLRKGEKT